MPITRTYTWFVLRDVKEDCSLARFETANLVNIHETPVQGGVV